MGTVSTALPSRYASLALNQLALEMDSFKNLPYNQTVTCANANKCIQKDSKECQEIKQLCRYSDGNAYLRARFYKETENISQVLNVDLNLLISLAFSVGLIIFNSVLYLLPLPATVKTKFRE